MPHGPCRVLGQDWRLLPRQFSSALMSESRKVWKSWSVAPAASARTDLALAQATTHGQDRVILWLGRDNSRFLFGLCLIGHPSRMTAYMNELTHSLGPAMAVPVGLPRGKPKES